MFDFLIQKAKKIFTGFVFLCACSSLCFAADQSHPFNSSLLQNSRQVILVQANNWKSFHGKLTLFQRKNTRDQWKKIGRSIPVVVGQNGIAWAKNFHNKNTVGPVKKEGDNKTPLGIFPISAAFGFKAKNKVTIHFPYTQLKQQTQCVDDAHSRYYNQIINASTIQSPDWNSSEHMRDYTVYQKGFVVGYNRADIPYRGSCIFR